MTDALIALGFLALIAAVIAVWIVPPGVSARRYYADLFLGSDRHRVKPIGSKEKTRD